MEIKRILRLVMEIKRILRLARHLAAYRFFDCLEGALENQERLSQERLSIGARRKRRAVGFAHPPQGVGKVAP